MRKDRDIKDWQKMYDNLMNPEKQAENRRKVEKGKRIKEKISDTGL